MPESRTIGVGDGCLGASGGGAAEVELHETVMGTCIAASGEAGEGLLDRPWPPPPHARRGCKQVGGGEKCGVATTFVTGASGFADGILAVSLVG
mmetsp:Transcript_80698/g.168303  ORF Transcript_80698/g.168303 Transcript_80698/m.168303 type:complete len:94 (-) Transcript_80698:365-646(-)